MKPQAPHDTTELGRGGNACIAAVPNQFGGELPVSAGLLELFLIVLVILCSGLCVIEKTGLRFGRHVIRTQAEAERCVPPSIRPGTLLSRCRIPCQPIAADVVFVIGVAPGPYPAGLMQ